MAAPVSNLADGNVKVMWVPAITNTAAPTATELNATGSIDLSCYLTADGYDAGGDEAVITDDRLCSTQTFEKPGRYSDTLTLRYVYRQQAAAGTDNKAFHTLVRGAAGYIVSRWGVDYAAPFAAADIVDVVPVQCGKQQKLPPEANSVLKISQREFVTGAVQRDVAVS